MNKDSSPSTAVLVALKDIIQYIDSAISNSDFECLEELQSWAEDLSFPWEEHVRFDNSNYCRVPLHKSARFDLLIVCWKPGQGSNYHQHPKQGCLMKVLKGVLQEEIRTSKGGLQRSNYNSGDTVYICDEIGQHRVTNVSGDNAVSFHIYAPGHYKP